MTSPRFLVLGSGSFSGAAFCDLLAEKGFDVLAASRSPEPHEALRPYAWRKRPGRVTFERIDLNHDLDRLEDLLRRNRVTHVVSYAAQSMVAQSWERPEDWMTTNVVSAVRLHAMLARLDFLDRFVHVSTPEVYGATQGWASEDAPYAPSTPYAVSRAAADMSVKAYAQAMGLPAVTTRTANVYGPGQPLYRIVPRAILAARGGGRLRLEGGGKALRVFIHARDAAEATLAVALGGAPGQVYHVSGYELTAIRDLVETIARRLGRALEDCVEPAPERTGQDRAYMLDSTRIRVELGWRDRIPLDEGLDECIAWAERWSAALPELPSVYVHKA